MKQTHHIGYVQTPSVKNLSNVKQALVENGLVSLTTPNEMLPDAIEKGLKTYNKDFGMIYEGKYRIRYFDIDGTILKIEYVEDGGKLTPPKKTPNYDPDYLIFDEWNYDIENYVVYRPTDIGTTYKTVGDATYMFCRFTSKTGLNPTLAIISATSIDWGDGVIDTNKSHTYTNEGEYIIKIYGDIRFNASSSNYLLGSNDLNKALRKCFIKNSVTSIKSNAFSNCNSLKIVTIPEGVTSIEESVFSYCGSLTSITIPEGVTSIGSSTFSNCNSLTRIIIPEGVTSIGSNAFKYCNCLKSVTIPESITSIEDSAFKYCECLTNYFIKCNTVPTLASTNAFSSINPSAIMWVNDNIIEQLKVATSWSTYANQMKPLSWYPSLTDPNAE